MSYKAALLSLGCKVNSYETERIREDLLKSGFEIVDFSVKADAYIINTCSVTNIADRKSRQMLHRARSLNPDAVVVATGCYVQTEKDSGKLKEACDLIIGNNHKGEISKLLTDALSKKIGNNDSILLDDISCEKQVEDLSIKEYPDRSRAFVRIEDGCNQFCSYCIIPYARGRVRSREAEDIIKEVENLADKGFKEVVITGIHISSYGYENYEKELKNRPDTDIIQFDGGPLLKLIESISKINGIERIRLGSLEPRIITKDFALGLKNVKSFCPHFHLSLQSGSDTVLKRMNRHYTCAEFLEKTEILRTVFDRPAITTDVIVGFPGETEEEFKETAVFVRSAAFSKMHIFKFSRRKGTVADRMPGQLTEKEKHERSLILQDLDTKMHYSYASSYVGETVRVLVEEEKEGFITGLTENYLTVNIESAENTVSPINRIIEVEILKIDENGILWGKFEKST